jgi:2,4-diacetylphloroglucinol hydrolase
MIPVTYYPVGTQKAFARNAQRIAGKPYAHYFNGDMVLHEDVLPALRAPMDPAHALTTSPADLNSLLDPGYHEVENGYCALPDGSAYVTSLTRFPGCTSEMFRWWFWWHSFEPERYTLWYPWNHVSVRRKDLAAASAPGLSHEQRYIGSTHIITEYIGPDRMKIEITFVDPASWGFDVARFAAAGISGHACGDVFLQPIRLRAGTMVHLIRDTDDGFELRSRYWLADRPSISVAGRELNLSLPATLLGIKRRLAGERVGYEQLLHDQIEFTHLASFLPKIYAEFGSDGP